MRPSNQFSNNQNPPYFFNPFDETKISSLNAQHLNIFDIPQIDPKFLRKREFQSGESFFQNDIQKKIKPSLSIIDQRVPFYEPDVSSAIIHRDLQLNSGFPRLHVKEQRNNSLLGPFKPNSQQNNHLKNFSFSARQEQELSMPCHPYLFTNFSSENFQNHISNGRFLPDINNINMKEEYIGIKQEDVQSNQKWNSLSYNLKHEDDDFNKENLKSDRLNQSNLETNNIQMPPLKIEPPSLVEFTQSFPDWDLATIFNFIRSGKRKDLFEKEKKTKNEKKSIKITGEGENNVEIKFRTTKPKRYRSKKTLDTNEEYKPPRTAKGHSHEKERNKKEQLKLSLSKDLEKNKLQDGAN